MRKQKYPTSDTEREDQPTEVPRRAWSIDEFAARWDLGRNSIYNEIATGALASITVGRRRLITAEQEEAWRRSKEAASAA